MTTDELNDLEILRVRVRRLEREVQTLEALQTAVAEALRFGPVRDDGDRRRLLQLVTHAGEVWDSLKEGTSPARRPTPV